MTTPSGTPGKAMSAERLAEIREYVADMLQWGERGSATTAYELAEYAQAILAEYDRMAAEIERRKADEWKLIHAYNERGDRLNAALEIVRVVAEAKHVGSVDWPVAVEVSVHEQARALLASVEQESGGKVGE